MSRVRLVVLLSAFLAIMAAPKSAQAQVADGGGCDDLVGLGADICSACVGVGYPLTLHANFYVNDFTYIDPSGYGALYSCIQGEGCYYKYTVFTDHYGVYPTAYSYVYGTGQSQNEVDFYTYYNSYIGTGISPTQYWYPNP